MNPSDFPELYESVILGGRKSPGIVTLTGHDRDQEWDVQKAKGQTGATSSRNGEPIGQFEASFYLVKDPMLGIDEFEEWDSFQALIESTTNGPTPSALTIYHPDLARNRFTEVVNGGITGMLHDGRGGGTVKVKFLEYRPPKPKPVKKAAPKPGASSRAGEQFGPPPPDPNAAAKQELSNLLDQARQP